MEKLRIEKPNFERENDKKLFIAESLGFCEAHTFWAYNQETNTLGHGDDQRDWNNLGQEFIASNEINEINVDNNGSIIIYYEIVYFNDSSDLNMMIPMDDEELEAKLRMERAIDEMEHGIVECEKWRANL